MFLISNAANKAAVILGLLAIAGRAEIHQMATQPWQGEDNYLFETVNLGEVGFDAAKLEKVAAYAEQSRSDSLVVLRGGKLVLEQYWNGKSRDSLQQMYSATKSPFAFLMGRLIQNGTVEGLDQSIVGLAPELMGRGREKLTFRGIMAMASGLEQSQALDVEDGRSERTQLQCVINRAVTSEPLTKYHYNNAGYRALFTAIERPTGQSLHEITRRELYQPLGMKGAYWVELYSGDRFLGYQSIRMRPIDLAKVGQVMLDGGQWNGQQYLDQHYVKEMVRPASIRANPSYALFWHVNGEYYRNYSEPDRIDRRPLEGTPSDAYFNYGSKGQMLVCVPSLDLVWVRTGTQVPVRIYSVGSTMSRLSQAICDSIVD